MEKNIRIIYEDACVIVLDKPSGVPTHMLKPDETGTVVNFLLNHCPSIKGIGTNELMSGLAHRLDTATSGIVLAVKDNESFLNIRKQFGEHKILKEYKLLVHDKYNGPKTISNFIGADPKSKKKVKVYHEEKKGTHKAITEIISKCFPSPVLCTSSPLRGEGGVRGDYTLLSVRIKTGVRHQIRAHFANLGYPLVGDYLYQNTKTRNKDQLGMKHHFLHAHKLGFYHPRTNEWAEFESRLPEELDEVIRRLSKRQMPVL